MTVQRNTCIVCGRTVYERGQAKIIEAARAATGDEPVEEFIAKLEVAAVRKKGRRETAVQRLADLADVFEDFARNGKLEVPRELNQLKDDLWEIKPGDVRLPFYETTDTAHGIAVVRLTSGFYKTQQLTQRHHINWALRVMREDRGHESL